MCYDEEEILKGEIEHEIKQKKISVTDDRTYVGDVSSQCMGR